MAVTLQGLKLPGAYKQGRSLLQRVEDSSMPVAETGCWVWLGAVLSDGYPQISGGPKGRPTLRVSRALLGLSRGDPRQANHHCDTPLCVNPAHLYVGTQSDNMKDLHRRRPLATGWGLYHERRRQCS